MQERRNERRQRTLKAGQVMLAAGAPVDCIVRDLSASGAHLEFDRRIELPRTFRLRLVTQNLSIAVATVWQRKLEAGVRFASADGKDAA